MLVLSRRVNERICIGQTIEVQVLESRNGRVKLGFIAPPEVAIHREEIYRQIQGGVKSAVLA